MEENIQKELKPVMDFSMRLFQECVKKEKGKNLLISPLSLLYALGIAMNGANGKTAKELEKVIGIPEKKLNQILYSFLKEQTENGQKELKIASAVYFKDDKEWIVNPQFLKVSRDIFRAMVVKESFNKELVEKINSWVRKNTDGMISDVGPVNEDTITLILNATAFKDKWKDEYTDSDIKDGIFTTKPGKKCRVKMMSSKESTYLEDGLAIGFIKPYVGKYDFLAMLPKRWVSIERYVKTLDGKWLDRHLRRPENDLVRAEIPSYKIKGELELNEILKKMGVQEAFGYKADFSKMMGPSINKIIYMDKIMQKSFISVDKVGTKATAVTAIKMSPIMVGLHPIRIPHVVKLNRPFIYMIIDRVNRLPIFCGVLRDPGDHQL